MNRSYRLRSLVVPALLPIAMMAGPAWGQPVVYVDAAATGAGDGTSWANAFTSVQAGLNAAASGAQVWVASGTYVENISLAEDVALYGGFGGDENPATFDLADRDFAVNETILDGNQAGSAVTAPTEATAITRIDGFTIRNGYGDYGGGIYCSDSSSPTITNNTVTGNDAHDGAGIYCSDFSFPAIANNTITGNSAHHGGGIYCYSSSPTITNNTITDNVALASGGGGIYCDSSSPTIANNTITGNSAGYGGGIYCSSSFPTIANNTITGNDAHDGGGIHCYSSSPTISNNTIMGNSAEYSGGGISCSDSSSPTITNNTITGNFGYRGGGVFCYWYSSPTLANNTITGNGVDDGGGIYCLYAFPTIANTIVAFNSSGIYNGGTGTPILRYSCVFGNTAYNYSGVTDPTGTDGNISTDPKLADTAYGNVHIQPDSPCRDAGDDAVVQPGWLDMDGEARIQGSHVDIGADESDGTAWPAGPYAIVRVRPGGDDANDGSSWALAKRTVQAGVDAASAVGGEVWVKSGTYLERITLLPYAYVYGGFAGTETQLSERDWVANVTILDGQAGGSVVTVRAGHEISTIDGFTIRNGSSSYGGGIYCCSGSLTIANNTITGNSADYGGGGISCIDFSSPTIANNTITGNSADDGGGIYCSSSSPTIANNTIAGNSADDGGGIYCSFSSPTIANNTITGNSADDGGGIYCYYASPTIANTIVAFNSSGIYNGGTDIPVLRHNCAFGNTAYDCSGVTDPTGTDGNISTDPLFVQTPDPGPDSVWGTADDDPGDVHLLEVSPCVDTGDNAYVTGDYDLDGNPRVVDGDVDAVAVVDMGAYEYSPVIEAADFDADGDVDLADFAQFARCFNGPENPPAPGCEVDADLDNDDDVDADDFVIFEQSLAAGGPGA